MKRAHSILFVAVCAALAAVGWLAWRSAEGATGRVEPESTKSLGAPTPEKLAALESAEVQAVESGSAPVRAAVEVRTIQTRAASIEVHPPKVASENRGMIIVWCYLENSHASIDPEQVVLIAADGRELRGADEKQKGTFRGLLAGSYSVLVRDSRFENVRIDSVTTGSHVLIDLVGTARVRPHAVDAETGAPIATSMLRLVDFGRLKECPPDAEGWFTGLPGGDLELRVSTPGYEEARLVVQGLLPDESREVDLRFSRSGEIRGVVLSDSSGKPVPNVEVRLDWLGPRDTMVELIESSGTPARGMRFVAALPVRSDAQGRFTIKDLRLGEYRVVASQSNLLESVAQGVVLATGDCVKEVVLRVPAGCTLTGTLTRSQADPVRGGFHGLRVLIQPPEAPGESRTEYAVAMVQPEGQFEFSLNLPVGRVQVLLAMRPQASGRDAGPYAPGTRLLGPLDLHAGRNECSFDISDLFPSWAEVELAGDGVEIDGGSLLLTSPEDGRDCESYEIQGTSCFVGPLPPGDYWLRARGADESWFSSTPVALRIGRGATTQLRLELRLVRGRLLLQDLEGTALPQGTQVRVWAAGAGGPAGTASLKPRLGEGGELALALEPGSYLIGLRSEVPFEWTASGPAQPVLRLPAK